MTRSSVRSLGSPLGFGRVCLPGHSLDTSGFEIWESLCHSDNSLHWNRQGIGLAFAFGHLWSKGGQLVESGWQSWSKHRLGRHAPKGLCLPRPGRCISSFLVWLCAEVMEVNFGTFLRRWLELWGAWGMCWESETLTSSTSMGGSGAFPFPLSALGGWEGGRGGWEEPRDANTTRALNIVSPRHAVSSAIVGVGTDNHPDTAMEAHITLDRVHKDKVEKALDEWQQLFSKPSYRGHNFLPLSNKGKALTLTYFNLGPWMARADTSDDPWHFACFCRCILDHALIGSYREHFFTQQVYNYGCSCGVAFESRHHLLSRCVRFRHTVGTHPYGVMPNQVAEVSNFLKENQMAFAFRSPLPNLGIGWVLPPLLPVHGDAGPSVLVTTLQQWLSMITNPGYCNDRPFGKAVFPALAGLSPWLVVWSVFFESELSWEHPYPGYPGLGRLLGWSGWCLLRGGSGGEETPVETSSPDGAHSMLAFQLASEFLGLYLTAWAGLLVIY